MHGHPHQPVLKNYKLRLQAMVRSVFGFSRTEPNAFLILLPLVALILFSEPAYRWWSTRQPYDDSRDARSLDSIIAHFQWDRPAARDTAPVLFFRFNPNTISSDSLVMIGLSRAMALRIQHYREKGGLFRKNEDLLKIYGIDSGWFLQANAWIDLPRRKANTSPMIHRGRKLGQDRKDINTADSLELLKVYGIGPVLSKRIRNFRNRLGGFVSMEQLREVYGLDSAVVTRIKQQFYVDITFTPVKINLNTVTKETFNHPYVHWKESQAILAFRLQHGNFQSIEQLREIEILTEAWIEKIRPYLTLE